MKKGFTLIELVSVIIILGVILVIAVPKIYKVITSSKIDTYISNVEMIKKSTEGYLSVNKNKVPQEIGETKEINLKDLIELGISKKVTSPFNKKECSGYVLVTKTEENKYDYTPHIDCLNNIDNSIDDKLVLNYKFNDFQEPTVNLAPYTDYSNRNYNVENNSNSWGGDSAKLYYYKEGGYNNLPYKKMIKTSGGTGGSYLDDNISFLINNNTKYAISAYIKSSIQESHLGHILNINRLSDNAYRLSNNFTIKKEWERYSWIYTSLDGHEGSYQSRHIIYSNNNLPLEIYWAGFQVEEKPYVTPFVNGTREGIVKDYSKNNNVATLSLDNTPRWIEDSNREGTYKFNGINTYINIENSEPINLTDKGTISMFVKPDRNYPSDSSSTAFRGLISKSINGSGTGTSFNIDWYGSNLSRNLRASIGDLQGSNNLTITNFDFKQQWTNIVFTWDGTKLILYSNGEKMGETNQTKTVQVLNKTIEIGRAFSSNNYIWDGLIDDTRIYNRALNEDEIKLLYETTK